MDFRIRKGTHVSHFHRDCALWPTENFYEQERPLWWGHLCDQCAKLADMDAQASFASISGGTPGPAAGNPVA